MATLRVPINAQMDFGKDFQLRLEEKSSKILKPTHPPLPSPPKPPPSGEGRGFLCRQKSLIYFQIPGYHCECVQSFLGDEILC